MVQSGPSYPCLHFEQEEDILNIRGDTD